MKTKRTHICHRLISKTVVLSIICLVSTIHSASVYGAPANIEFEQSSSTIDTYDFIEIILKVEKPVKAV